MHEGRELGRVGHREIEDEAGCVAVLRRDEKRALDPYRRVQVENDSRHVRSERSVTHAVDDPDGAGVERRVGQCERHRRQVDHEALRGLQRENVERDGIGQLEYQSRVGDVVPGSHHAHHGRIALAGRRRRPERSRGRQPDGCGNPRKPRTAACDFRNPHYALWYLFAGIPTIYGSLVRGIDSNIWHFASTIRGRNAGSRCFGGDRVNYSRPRFAVRQALAPVCRRGIRCPPWGEILARETFRVTCPEGVPQRCRRRTAVTGCG